MDYYLVSIWSLTLAMFLLAVLYSRRKKRLRIEVKKTDIHPWNISLYHFLLRFTYSRSLVLRYQYSLKQLTRLRDEDLFNRTGDFFRKLILAFLLILCLLLFITQSIIHLGVYLFVTLVLLEVFMDYILVKRHNQLLKGQILFDELVRQKYHEQGTVEEAVYEACQEFVDKSSPMLIQGEYIYDVLMESNVEEAVQIYNQQAPNKYLKMLLNLCFITAEYGDSQENGQSIFMNSLSHLTNELRVEEMKRDRLNYSLKSLHFIAIIPLMCMLPLQKWASSNFEPLRIFYESRWGKLVEITMFFIILAVVMILRKIQNIGILADIKIEPRPKLDLAKRKRRIRLFSFALGILIIFIINRQEHDRLLESSVLETGMMYADGNQEYRQILRQKEKEWLQNLPNHISKAQAIPLLLDQAKRLSELGHLQGRGLTLYVERLYQKHQALHRGWIEIWQIGIVFLISFGLGYWYLLSGLLVKTVREMEREDEVAGYRSILLMLMYHSRMGMEEILSWLNMFAHYYEERFDRCLNSFSMGVEEAFAELKKENQADFQNLVFQLEAASKDLSLQQAFDDLVHEKVYYLEKRKEVNRQMISKRLAMGEILGFLPAYSLILLYLIIPMVYSGIDSLNQFYQGMG